MENTNKTEGKTSTLSEGNKNAELNLTERDLFEIVSGLHHRWNYLFDNNLETSAKITDDLREKVIAYRKAKFSEEEDN